MNARENCFISLSDACSICLTKTVMGSSLLRLYVIVCTVCWLASRYAAQTLVGLAAVSRGKLRESDTSYLVHLMELVVKSRVCRRGYCSLWCMSNTCLVIGSGVRWPAWRYVCTSRLSALLHHGLTCSPAHWP